MRLGLEWKANRHKKKKKDTSQGCVHAVIGARKQKLRGSASKEDAAAEELASERTPPARPSHRLPGPSRSSSPGPGFGDSMRRSTGSFWTGSKCWLTIRRLVKGVDPYPGRRRWHFPFSIPTSSKRSTPCTVHTLALVCNGDASGASTCSPWFSKPARSRIFLT